MNPATTMATPPASLHDSSVADPGDRGTQRHFRAVHLWWLAVITLLAAALRLYRLEDWGFWVDEAHTWRDVTLPMSGEDSFWESARRYYPLSYLFLRAMLDWGLMPSMGEGWLRLPFAFCGIVSVPLLALFGQHFVGRRAALLAALFLAVNPWHIYWSQSARAYVLVFFFATLGAGTFWIGTVRQRARWLAVGIAATLVGGFCHPTGHLLLPALVAYPLLNRPGVESRPAFWWKVIGVVTAIVILAQVLQFVPPLQEFARVKPDASLTHLIQTTAFYFRIPLLLTALLGVWLLFQTRLQGRALFLACWALVPLLVLALLGSTVVKVTARYAFCALPAVMLLAGGASVRMGQALVSGLSGRGVLGVWLPAALVPVVLTMDMVSYDYLYFSNQCGDRGCWRQAAQHVTSNAADGRILVYTINEPSMLYYLRPRHFNLGGQQDPYPDRQVIPLTDWDVADAGGGKAYLESGVARARSQGRGLFLVVTLPELAEMDGDGSLLKTLQEQFELDRVLPVWVGPKDETIYVYRPLGPRGK